MGTEVTLPLGLNDVQRDWMDRAYCRINDVPHTLFFPEPGNSHGVITARKVCDKCEVSDECLNYALNNYLDIGIFGGKSGRERRILQRERKNEQSKGQGDKG